MKEKAVSLMITGAFIITTGIIGPTIIAYSAYTLAQLPSTNWTFINYLKAIYAAIGLLVGTFTTLAIPAGAKVFLQIALDQEGELND